MPASIPAPAGAPVEPAVARRAELPAAQGVLGHWRYTQAVWAWFRAWRDRVAAEDAAVRDAVDARDAALVALGEATRVLVQATPADAELSAFAATLDRFEAEAGSLGTRHAELEAAAARARTDLDAAIRGFDLRLATLRQTSAPQELTATGLRQRLQALSRQQVALATRNARAPDPAIAVDLERNEQQRATLQAELDALDATLAGLRRQTDALLEEQHLVQKAGERECAALSARAAQALTQGGQVVDRRRATLMDLGHEALRRNLGGEALAGPRTAAQAGIARLDAARAHREAVLDERRTIDLAPCYRTLAVAAALTLGLILLALVA